jgi:hypothetical protein
MLLDYDDEMKMADKNAIQQYSEKVLLVKWLLNCYMASIERENSLNHLHFVLLIEDEKHCCYYLMVKDHHDDINRIHEQQYHDCLYESMIE